MNDPKATSGSTRASLARMLELTRGNEIDCEGFAQHLAALVEGNVEPELKALMDHHRVICPECDEEREALERALASDP
ncbi:MAG: hypothetical protein KUG77_09665 [Nannocystaceae bacterium]|nr:hypothetical protein [Nannocystaceae bacterium]